MEKLSRALDGLLDGDRILWSAMIWAYRICGKNSANDGDASPSPSPHYKKKYVLASASSVYASRLRESEQTRGLGTSTYRCTSNSSTTTLN